MNDSGIIAKRYAEALFNLCLKEKNLAEVEKAFESFVREAAKNPRFVEFMESPVIPHQNKTELLSKVIPADMPALLVLFLKLVLTKKRFQILTAIKNAFRSCSEKHRGIHKAELITVVPMEPGFEKSLIALLEKKLAAQKNSAPGNSSAPARVDLVTKIDKNLLGGFILKLDERVVDASYQTKLRELRQKLSAVYV